MSSESGKGQQVHQRQAPIPLPSRRQQTARAGCTSTKGHDTRSSRGFVPPSNRMPGTRSNSSNTRSLAPMAFMRWVKIPGSSKGGVPRGRAATHTLPTRASTVTPASRSSIQKKQSPSTRRTRETGQRVPNGEGVEQERREHPDAQLPSHHVFHSKVTGTRSKSGKGKSVTLV